MLGGWPGRVAGRAAGFTNYWCNFGCAKSSLSLGFLMFDTRTNILSTFFHEFFSASARFACPSLCLEHFPSEMQNLQNGFGAGKSERQRNSLVPEKPLIILNVVPAWTKLKKTTLQWRVLIMIMQSKMLICHVCPIAGEIFFASLSPKCSNFSVLSPSSNYSCQNPFPGNGDTRNSLGSRFFSVSGIA